MVVPPIAVVIIVVPEIIADIATAIGQGVGRDVAREVPGLRVACRGAVAKAAVRGQRGMRSRFYTRGRYSPTREAAVHHFHRTLAAMVPGG